MTPSWPGAQTRPFAVLGFPVRHSLSPAMHNAAFRALGLDACYLALAVAPPDLGPALAGARALGFGGLNVTVPHKEQALAVAAEVDPEAREIGAANTLVPCPGGWRAHNTDAEGLLRGLAADLGFRAPGRRCLILGAGGAARAAAVALRRAGAKEILVANRNVARAQALAATLARVEAVDLAAAPGRLGPGDLVVSATPEGLDPKGRWPWPPSLLSAGTYAYDLAYRPGGETALALAAREAGLIAASGRSMLLHQGALAFTLWTGSPPPLDAMTQALAPPAEPPEADPQTR